MKKFFVGILAFFCILVNVSFGYTLTVNGFSVNVGSGRRVTTTANLEGSFTSWTSSGVTLTATQHTSPTITFTMPGNDVTLVSNYGEVTNKTYTITYDANGGSGTPSSQIKTHGADLTLSSTEPTKEGYSFLGWATTDTATSAEYSAGGTFTTDANTTLYAIWKEIILGDVNDDGVVNQLDLTRLQRYLNDNTTTINSVNADVNMDGVIDSADLTALGAMLI